MKTHIFSSILLAIVLTFNVVAVRAQSENRKLEEQIKDLLTQFYAVNDVVNDVGSNSATLAKTAPAAQRLAESLTENFTFAQGNDQTTNKQTLLETWRRNAIGGDLNLFESVNDKFQWKVVPEITDLIIEQKDDEAHFKFNRVILSLLTFRGEEAETFRRNERFAATGTAVSRNGKWLLSNLRVSPLKRADYSQTEIDDAKKFDEAVGKLLDAALEKENEKAIQKAKSLARLQKEVQQFFVDAGLVTSSAQANQNKNNLMQILTDDFVMTSETNDGSSASLAPFAKMISLSFRQQAVTDKKLFVTNRNLRVFQNGETIVAIYDTLYFRDAEGQKKLEARERHQSVFVRRAGKLLWMADHSAKLPDAPYNETPRGWIAHFASAYRMGLDSNIKHGGETSVFLEREQQADSRKAVELSQIFPAKNFQGKRVQLTGFVKGESVAGDADIYLLVDQQSFSDAAMLAFVSKESGTLNLLKEKGRIQGTTDWKSLTVTLDVPSDAAFVTISAILRGAGRIWLDDFSLKIVGGDVPVSYVIKKSDSDFPPPPSLIRQGADEPINLNFEDN